LALGAVVVLSAAVPAPRARAQEEPQATFRGVFVDAQGRTLDTGRQPNELVLEIRTGEVASVRGHVVFADSGFCQDVTFEGTVQLTGQLSRQTGRGLIQETRVFGDLPCGSGSAINGDTVTANFSIQFNGEDADGEITVQGDDLAFRFRLLADPDPPAPLPPTGPIDFIRGIINELGSELEQALLGQLPDLTPCVDGATPEALGPDLFDRCRAALALAESLPSRFASRFTDPAILDSVTAAAVLGALPGNDGGRAFPSVQALAPVLVNLAVRGDQGSDGAADTMRSLIDLTAALDASAIG
jgi:hypothetical protein